MKIDLVEAIPYRLPMRKSLRFASGQVDYVEHVLLRIRTDDGLVGVADIPPRPYTYGDTPRSVVAVMETIFRPALLGEDPFERNKIHSVLNRTVGNVTAKAGVDIALWDILGQALGQPVHRLLGGFSRSVRVSHMVGFDETDAMVAEALRYREVFGVTTFKVKVGRAPIKRDIEAVRTLRENLGDEVELYLDANRGWTALEARRVMDATADLDLLFFEEPCDAGEVMGRRRLVSQSRIAIVADESASTLPDAARELHTGGATALSVKIARTGFTESQKILGLAEGLGVETLIGNQIDSQIGSSASVALAAGIEHAGRHAAELSNYLDMADDLIAEPLTIANGRIDVSNTPGVGASVDPDKLQHYRVDGAH